MKNRPPFLIEFGDGNFRYVFDVRDVIGIGNPLDDIRHDTTLVFTSSGQHRILASFNETLAKWSEAKIAWDDFALSIAGR